MEENLESQIRRSITECEDAKNLRLMTKIIMIVKNERRIDLLNKKLYSELTAEETDELNVLQDYASSLLHSELRQRNEELQKLLDENKL